MKILITDIDETLLSWSPSFDLFLRDNYNYHDIYIGESTKRLWDLVDMGEKSIGDLMAEHCELDRFSQLNYYRDAKLLLDTHKVFDKIFAITACGTAENIVAAREKNVNEKFPNIIDKIFYVDFLQSKETVIKDIINEYPTAEFYMIDDSVNDIETAINLGINGFVFKAPFHTPGNLPTVDSFSEFMEKVLK